MKISLIWSLLGDMRIFWGHNGVYIRLFFCWVGLQPMVHCWFGAWSFGILRVLLSHNPFDKGNPGIQTTNPNQQFTMI